MILPSRQALRHKATCTHKNNSTYRCGFILALGLVALLSACVEPPKTTSRDMAGEGNITDMNEDLPDISIASDMHDQGRKQSDMSDMMDLDTPDLSDMNGTTSPCQADAAPDTFRAGDGSEGNAYLICTPEDLMRMETEEATRLQNSTPGAYYVLGQDIDLSTLGDDWEPISCFQGTLDGGNHTISNITITHGSAAATNQPQGCNREFDNAGGFINEMRGTITNLNFKNVTLGTSTQPLPMRYTSEGSDMMLQHRGGLFGHVAMAELRHVSLDTLNAYVQSTAGGIASVVANSTLEDITITNSQITSSAGALGGFAHQVFSTQPVSEGGTQIQGLHATINLYYKAPQDNMLRAGLFTAILNHSVELKDSEFAGTISFDSTNSDVLRVLLGGLIGHTVTTTFIDPDTITADDYTRFKSLQSTISNVVVDLDMDGCTQSGDSKGCEAVGGLIGLTKDRITVIKTGEEPYVTPIHFENIDLSPNESMITTLSGDHAGVIAGSNTFEEISYTNIRVSAIEVAPSNEASTCHIGTETTLEFDYMNEVCGGLRCPDNRTTSPCP